MSNSRKIGPLRIRPHKRDGVETGKWYVDVPASMTSTGKRVRRFFDNRRTASEIAKEVARELRLRSLGVPSEPQRSGLSFAQAVELWAADEDLRVRTRKKRQISLDTDRARLKSAIEYFRDDDLATLTARRLAQYQAWRLQHGRSADTINSDVKSVMKVLKWAFKCKRLQALPEVEAVASEPRRVRPLTDAEVVALIQATRRRHRCLFRFLAETGCRAGEAFNLTWDDVDLDNGVITIRSKGGWTPKTRSSARDVYIGGDLLDELKGLPRGGVYVFSGRDPNRPITNIRKAFATALRKAGLNKNGARITPHSLRKAYATRLAMQGTPQRILQANLGHTPGSRVTDQYYVSATEEARRQAFRPLPIPALPRQGVAISGNDNRDQRTLTASRSAN